MASDETESNPAPDAPGTPAAAEAEIAVPAPARRAPEHFPGRRRWVAGFLIILAIALGEAVVIFRRGTWKPASAPTAASGPKILFWQDPMHPQFKSDKPGKAPDCGMDLVPVYEEPAAPKSAGEERKILYWQDPMNPRHRSDTPGKAPDGMDLVPVYEEETGNKGQQPLGGGFRITPEKQQLIGVQYEEVARQSLTRTIRATARLIYDERRIVHVHSKVDGWIDKVHVDFIGQLVTRGQPLIGVYSPELVATQDEYLLALRARKRLGNSAFEGVSTGAKSLLEAARRRLEFWDISDEQIAEIETSGKPAKTLTLFSPANGFVIARNSFGNQRITPETELYTIADLSTVWATADFYEYEARGIQLGQRIVLTLSSFPGRTFVGKIDYIYPQIDETTRTLKVRAELPNADFALKPEMYANAELKIGYGRRLAIPQAAVLDSGAEQLVFVARDGGYFEPRKVLLGDKVDNEVIVLGGLMEGERIVSSGNFLVDSESRLKAAASGMGMPGLIQGEAGENKPRKQSDQAAPQTSSTHSAEHAQHRHVGQAPEKNPPMDHAGHQMKPGPKNHD